MNDTFNLIDDQSTQIFYASTIWQTWRKPSNAKMISVFVIGGGAGGGSGNVASSNNVTKNAGGGGGSSAYTYATFPAFCFPDTVYIQVGSGGRGGTQGTTAVNGSPGSISYISSTPAITSSIDIILASATTAPGGGNGAGGAGSAGGIFTLAGSFVAQMAMVSGAAGVGGGSGGNPGGSITPTLIITPGAGGGGCNSVGLPFVGGSINAYGIVPSLAGGAAGPIQTSTVAGGDGQDGISWLNESGNPMFFTGGSGGGASGSGRGGKGGNGAYGCGGGGGGGGLSTGGGNGGGGNGGDGLVIITCY
jgi:hypothetical protein